jgi:uncharacterized protein HemY
MKRTIIIAMILALNVAAADAWASSCPEGLQARVLDRAGDYTCMCAKRDVSEMIVVRHGTRIAQLKDVYENATILSTRNENDMRIAMFQYGEAREKISAVVLEMKRRKSVVRIDCLSDDSHSSRAYFMCRAMAERVATASPVELPSFAESRAAAAPINDAIARGDLDHARRLWKKMTDDTMDKPALTVKLARLDSAFEDARAVFEKYAPLWSGTRGASAATDAAMAALSLGDTVRAERYLTKALHWDKGYLPAYKTLARLKLASGASVDEVAALVRKYMPHASSAEEKKELSELIDGMDSLTAE